MAMFDLPFVDGRRAVVQMNLTSLTSFIYFQFNFLYSMMMLFGQNAYSITWIRISNVNRTNVVIDCWRKIVLVSVYKFKEEKGQNSISSWRHDGRHPAAFKWIWWWWWHFSVSAAVVYLLRRKNIFNVSINKKVQQCCTGRMVETENEIVFRIKNKNTKKKNLRASSTSSSKLSYS